MKITTVQFDNFRGFTSAFNFNGLDVFCGPTGRGKTRVLMAVQLAMSGTVPDPDNDKNIETLKLFSQADGVGQMNTSVTFDDGTQIVRGFKIVEKDGADSVKESIVTTPDWGLGLKETQRKIIDQIGSFPVMLDINEFIGMSELEKAKFIASFCPVDTKKWTRAKMLLQLEETISGIYGEDVWLAVQKNLPSNGTEGLNLLLNYLKRRESELSKEVKTNDATSQGALKSQTADATQSFRNVEDIRMETAQTQAERNKLVQTIAEARATKEAVERLEKEKGQLKERINYNRSTLKGRNSTDLLKQRNDEIEKEQLVPERSEENRLKLKDCQQKTAQMQQDLAVHQSEIAELIRQLDLLKTGKCPVCGQVATVVVEAIGEKLKAKEVIADKYRTNISDLTANVAELMMAIDKETNSIQETERTNARVRARAVEIGRELADVEGAESAIKMMEERLAELEATQVKGMSTNLAEAERMLAGVDTALDRLNKEAKEKQQYDTKILMAKETALNAQKARETLEQVKALIKRAQSLRLQIIGEALEAIKEETNNLFHLVYPQIDFVFRLTDGRGNEALRFGWERPALLGGTTFVDFDSLSRGEKLITLSALLPPLINRGNPKLRVLMLDDIEVISEEYFTWYLKMLESAREQYLDNIMCTTSGPEAKVKPASMAWHNLLKG